MNTNSLYPKSIPHLTPGKLVGRMFDRNTFQGIEVALVGYCPRPRCLDQYEPRDTPKVETTWDTGVLGATEREMPA